MLRKFSISYPTASSILQLAIERLSNLFSFCDPAEYYINWVLTEYYINWRYKNRSINFAVDIRTVPGGRVFSFRHLGHIGFDVIVELVICQIL